MQNENKTLANSRIYHNLLYLIFGQSRGRKGTDLFITTLP